MAASVLPTALVQHLGAAGTPATGGVIGLMVSLFLILAFQVCRAPFRQRDEARQELTALLAGIQQPLRLGKNLGEKTPVLKRRRGIAPLAFLSAENFNWWSAIEVFNDSARPAENVIATVSFDCGPHDNPWVELLGRG
jgi:hypothetical protein